MRPSWPRPPAAALPLAMLLAVVPLLGCDTKPAPPRKYFILPVKVVTVATNSAERQAIGELEQARVNYDVALRKLHSHYAKPKTGYIAKALWAKREWENLRQAQTFRWRGIRPAPAPSDQLTDADSESLLAEDAVRAREAYQAAVQALRSHLEARGDGLKAKLLRNMQERFDPICTYYYIDSAEYPPLSLRPLKIIPEANQLYDRAHKLFMSGKGLARTFFTTHYDKQRQALGLFKQLIHRYPDSSRIALSAYFIGDIYKEYFDEDLRAVNWYERAWTWAPTISEPARFQAATVYDLRLNNKPRALDLYKGAIEHEHFSASNVRYARRRISEIRTTAARQKQKLRRTPRP